MLPHLKGVAVEAIQHLKKTWRGYVILQGKVFANDMIQKMVEDGKNTKAILRKEVSRLIPRGSK